MTYCSVLCDWTLSGSWNVSTRHHSVCAVRDSLQWFVAVVHCRVARFRRKSHRVSWLITVVHDCGSWQISVFSKTLHCVRGSWLIMMVYDCGSWQSGTFPQDLTVCVIQCNVVRDSLLWFVIVVRGRVARFRKTSQLKKWPVSEVMACAFITSVIDYTVVRGSFIVIDYAVVRGSFVCMA